MSGLNSAQNEAVHYVDGPSLVLAGAGSGKTRVITQKIAHLIQEINVSAKHIAAVTFTNKASREMQDRAARLLDKGQAKGLLVCEYRRSENVYNLLQDHDVVKFRITISGIEDFTGHNSMHWNLVVSGLIGIIVSPVV